MSAVLINLAMMLSFCLFVFSLGIGLLKGISLWALFIRSSVIFMVSSVLILLFFRYFNWILIRFLSQRIREGWENRNELNEEDNA